MERILPSMQRGVTLEASQTREGFWTKLTLIHNPFMFTFVINKMLLPLKNLVAYFAEKLVFPESVETGACFVDVSEWC